MLATMLSLNPEDRPTCEKVLVDYRNTIFPDYFYTFLQDYVNDMHHSQGTAGPAGPQDPTVKFASRADEIVEAIADDWSGIIRAVIQEHQLSVGNNDAEHNGEPKTVDHSKLAGSPIFSTLMRYPSSRTRHPVPEYPDRQHAELSPSFVSHQGA
jgi:hypothetical protein